LTLLTEQLKNQDPLSPLDSTEFVNQLVDFSGVEQQIAQNENLETLIGLQYGASFGAAAGYLGRDALIAGDAAPLTGGQAEWSYMLPSDAATSTVTITDAAGKVVHTRDGAVTAGEHSLVWDGLDNNGEPLPEGAYTLQVTALNAAGDTIQADIKARGRVTGADFTGQEPALLLSGLRVPLAEVLEVREPRPDTTAEDAA